jgi:uncharacterized membrane protein YgcG
LGPLAAGATLVELLATWPAARPAVDVTSAGIERASAGWSALSVLVLAWLALSVPLLSVLDLTWLALSVLLARVVGNVVATSLGDTCEGHGAHGGHGGDGGGSGSVRGGGTLSPGGHVAVAPPAPAV